MHIFRHIFLSNYWWQRSDIWSQASYRYPISWEAFLDPSDSYFLFADFPKMLPTIWYTYMMLVTKYQISVINSYWEKCGKKYLGRTEVKQYTPLPLWGAGVYFVDLYTHWTYMLIFRRIFLGNYRWQKFDIWSQASYRYTILWVAFLDRK
jgi:hypothetical protein